MIGKQPLRSGNVGFEIMNWHTLCAKYAKGTKFLRNEETREISSSNCEVTMQNLKIMNWHRLRTKYATKTYYTDK